jgi:ElaB/YqjD/DUF883 family membrane-anchored ribosome-binding protein
MKTTETQVNEGIEELKSDARRVRDDMVRLVQSAKSRSRMTIMQTGDRIRDMMTDLRDKAKEQFHDKSDALRDKSEVWKDRGRETVENWRGGIEGRPMTSLAIAFVAGLVLGTVIAHRRD